MLSSKVWKISKVVVCGMKGVGKTTILYQLIYGNHDEMEASSPIGTIEDIFVANIETDRGTKERVQFYDTAGIEYTMTSTGNGASTGQQLPRQYFGFADGYVLVYDTARRESYDVLVALKKDIDKNKDKKEVTVIVVGNQRAGPPEDDTVNKVCNWCAREKLRHFIADSRKRHTLYEAFIFLATRLNPPPSKSTFPQLSMGRKVVKTESS